MKAMWVVVCVVVAAAVCGSALGVESFDRMVPEGTFAYASVGDVPGLLGKLKETAGYKLVERLMPPEPAAQMKQSWERYVEPLGEIFTGEVAFAITTTEGIEETPRLVLLADVSEGGEAALKKYLEESIYPLLEKEGIEPEEVTCRGAAFTKVVPDPDAPEDVILFGVADEVLMAATQVGTLEEVMALRADAAGKRLSGNAAYADVERALGDTDVRVYFDFAALLGLVRDEDDEKAEAWQSMLGLSEVRAIGHGVRIGPEGGTTTTYFSTGGPPSGLIGALVRGGGPLKSLKYVPDDTALLVAFNSEGLSALYKALAAGLASLSEATGGTEAEGFARGVEQLEAVLGMKLDEEVLSAFGGEVVLSAKVPETLGMPPAAVLIEVKDKAAVEKFVARVFELIDESSDGAVGMTSMTYAGTKITTVLASPAITPGVAVLDDFLVVGTHPNVVRGIIDTGAGKVNIGTKADFVTAMQGLPADGAMTMYIDLKALFEFAYPLLASSLPAGRPWPGAMEALGALGKEFSGFAIAVWGDEDGFWFRRHSASVLLEPALGFAAGAIVPALGRARDAARQAASINNMKQLCAAIWGYALDHENELPEKLSDLVPKYVDSAEVFLHPSSGTSAKLIDLAKPGTIDEHADYELVVRGNIKGFEAPEKVVMIREKEQFSKRGRVVGYLDGHVDVVRDEGGEARAAQAKHHIAAFSAAVKMYCIDMGRCPTAEEGLKALIEKPAEEALARSWKGPYVKVADGIPLDPWGNEYIYMSPGEGGAAFEIISLGKDGAVGGEGENADISSERLGE